MRPRITVLYRKLSRLDLIFIAALLLYALLALGPTGAPDLLRLAVYALGVAVTIRLARIASRRILWRLRNRLIVAYLFIAVVPIMLILILVGISTFVLSGQMAAHLVSSELDRRIAALLGPAQFLARTAASARADVLKRMSAYIQQNFSDFEVAIEDRDIVRYPEDSELEPPPAAWKASHGIVVKEGRLFAWAHAIEGAARVTVLAPLHHDYLASLVPNLGDVFFLNFGDLEGANPDPQPRKMTAARRRGAIPLEESKGPRRNRVPPAYNDADIQITGAAPMTMAKWEEPGKMENGLLVINTRPSAVLRIVFGQRLDWGQGFLLAFLVVGTTFLIVELISLLIGVSLTRTITSAVHNLYIGTQHVREGDFSHRIHVSGKDQLAELGDSFNVMTGNLQRLIVVEKEKERLQSELTIAREVQSQLFPKNVPSMKTLQLTGVCQPARMVSGDYYDFMPLADSKLAFAIGDVAGKGISAALLMAAIQSTMRTQLNGSGGDALSSAQLVSVLNKQLYANTSPEKYATFYFGIYDEVNSVLTYTNAGHLQPILVRNGETQPLEVTGTVVGAFPFSKYEEQRVELKSGDVLVAYTDGITEPENEYGEMFGEERLKDLVAQHVREEPAALIDRVMQAVVQWTGSPELQDDMTMLVVRRA